MIPTEAQAASVTIFPIVIVILILIGVVIASDVPQIMAQARAHLFVNLNLLHILSGAKTALDDTSRRKEAKMRKREVEFDDVDDMEWAMSGSMRSPPMRGNAPAE